MAPTPPAGPLDALHEQLRAALDAHIGSLSHQYEEALAAARCEIAAEADQAVAARLEAARAEWAAKLETEVADVRSEAQRRLAAAVLKAREDADAEWTGKLEREVAAARAEAERRLAADSMKARMEAEQEAAESNKRVRQELEQALAAERERASAELADLRKQVVTLEAERTRAQADLEAERTRAQTELQAERQRSTTDTDALRRRIEALQEEARKAQAEVEAERRRAAADSEEARREAASRIEAMREQTASQVAAQVEAVRREIPEQLERARREAREEAAREHASRAPAVAAPGDRSSSSAGFERLPAAMEGIAAARTLSEALDSLLRHAAGVASRSIVFLVNGERLRSWKTIGFPQLETTPFESAISGAGLMAQAVQTSQMVSSGPGQPSPTFAALPADRASVAVPLIVGGRAVAILYADTGGAKGGDAPASWREMIDALGRHTSTVLALLTALRTAQAFGAAHGSNGEGDEQSARRYARLLVSEIKLYNEAAVRAGRERRDLLDRLRPEIDRARRLYEDRVPPHVGGRNQYFQQELVQTLADGDPALLGTP